MRQRMVVLALMGSLAACADLLGIDDGIPRDGSAADVGASDTPTVDAPSMDAPVETGPFSPLSCGGSTCNFAVGETCCRTDAASYVCVDAGGMCKGLSIPCDRPEQCAPGDAGPRVCCSTDVLTDAGYIASSVGCTLWTQCTPIPAHYVMCGDDDGGADCPEGSTCAQSTSTLPPFLICR